MGRCPWYIAGPLIGALIVESPQPRHVARTAALSFIVVLGLTKALTNYAAGRLSDTLGRKKVLIGGWAVAVPVPFILMWAPTW